MSLTYLIIFIIIVILIITYKNKENFRLYLSGPTKCFSCEKAIINKYGFKHAYLAQPTKCFSCEKQIARESPYHAILAQPTKCFSCEKQYLAN